MGTNYYVCWNENRPRKCPTCFSELPTEVNKKRLHIGKSSAGLVFTFRSYTNEELRDNGAPEDIGHTPFRYEIQSLEDWLRALTQEGPWIENEYGATLSLEMLLSAALVRSAPISEHIGSDVVLLGNGLRCLKEDRARIGPSHTYTFVGREFS